MTYSNIHKRGGTAAGAVGYNWHGSFPAFVADAKFEPNFRHFEFFSDVTIPDESLFTRLSTTVRENLLDEDKIKALSGNLSSTEAFRKDSQKSFVTAMAVVPSIGSAMAKSVKAVPITSTESQITGNTNEIFRLNNENKNANINVDYDTKIREISDSAEYKQTMVTIGGVDSGCSNGGRVIGGNGNDGIYTRVTKLMSPQQLLPTVNSSSLPLVINSLIMGTFAGWVSAQLSGRSVRSTPWVLPRFFVYALVYNNCIRYYFREKRFNSDFERNQMYAFEEIRAKRDEQRVKEALFASKYADDPIRDYRVKIWQVARCGV